MNKPTEKQENAVLFICKRLKITPPSECSKGSYWKFINDNLQKAQDTEEPDERMIHRGVFSVTDAVQQQ